MLKSILKRNSNSFMQNNYSSHGKKYDIFLSYHWKDQVEIIKLHRELEKYGFQVWLDLVEVRFGDDLSDRIESAIRDSNLFLCCINNEYLNTPNCKYELVKAISLNEASSIYVLPFEQVDSMSELFNMKFEHIYEPCNVNDCIKVDNDISSILKFLFGNKNYPSYSRSFRRLYNCIPSVQAYRA